MDKFIVTSPRGDKFVLPAFEEFITSIRSAKAPFSFQWLDQLHMKPTSEGILLYTPDVQDHTYIHQRVDGAQNQLNRRDRQPVQPVNGQETMASIQEHMANSSYKRNITVHHYFKYTDSIIISFVKAMRADYKSFLDLCERAQSESPFAATVIASIRNLDHTPFKRAMCFLADIHMLTSKKAAPHILQYVMDRDISMMSMIFGSSYAISNTAIYTEMKGSRLYTTGEFKIGSDPTVYTVTNKVRVFHATSEVCMLRMSDVLVARKNERTARWDSVAEGLTSLKHDYNPEV